MADGAVFGRLSSGTFAPVTGGDVVSLCLAAQKVHRDGRELTMGTTLHEDDMVVGGDVKKNTKLVRGS